MQLLEMICHNPTCNIINLNGWHGLILQVTLEAFQSILQIRMCIDHDPNVTKSLKETFVDLTKRLYNATYPKNFEVQ